VAIENLYGLIYGELIERFNGYSWVPDLAYSIDGNYLAALYSIPDDLVQIWQLSNGKLMTNLIGTNFTRVAHSLDRLMLATVTTMP
jgi:hypothetical protein